MDKWLEDVLPLYGVEHDCILSKRGDVTVVFRVQLPEIFTLSTADYENIHQCFVKAIRVLPKHCVLHKQDWYLKKKYHSPKLQDSFLNGASSRYFEGRPYLDHSCYLYLTRIPADHKLPNSLFSSLTKSPVPAQTMQEEFLEDFVDVCNQFRHILESSGLMKLERLTENGILSGERQVGVIEQYCMLADKPREFLIRDIDFQDGIKIGDYHALLYSLGDAEDMPHLCGPRITYDKYSTDQTNFSVGFSAPAGLLLSCNHIYNQYIFIGDGQRIINDLEKKRLRLQSLSAYSRDNSISRNATNDFLNEAIGDQRLPVNAHFNILAWTDDKEELKELKNLVGTALAQMDCVAKQETSGAAQIFWAGIPGNAADFPTNDTFLTFAEQSSCFLNVESNYRSDPPETGIRFCDRISHKPVFLDLFDRPRKTGVTQNMGMLVCGSSGGGKSMTVNAILRTMYDQGAHCVVVDIGGSYRALNDLVKGYYFTYTEDDPIRFNPFYLPDGVGLDTEKKESLKSLLLALWKQDNEQFNRSEYVALSNALQGYYHHLKMNSSIFPCFNTFYEYLQSEYQTVLASQGVKEKDFDMGNFLYVLRPYYTGGEFDYLLNATENLDLLNQPFVVVELDNIKDNPILFPVVTLILVEMFISKMRKLAGVRKVLVIDEAWKAITKSGMAEFLKYAFKTIRKFNGVPCVITQELDDLVSSPIIKDAIINNADIKILMDMKKFINKFDKLQDTLGLSDKGKNILLSVNKDHREIFIDLGGQEMKVYKNELCPEEYFAYTTDGKERVKVLEYAERYGSMDVGLERLVADLKNK